MRKSLPQPAQLHPGSPSARNTQQLAWTIHKQSSDMRQARLPQRSDEASPPPAPGTGQLRTQPTTARYLSRQESHSRHPLLPPRGHTGVRHGFEHLRGRDDGFAQTIGFAEDSLLNKCQAFHRHLHPQIAPGNQLPRQPCSGRRTNASRPALIQFPRFPWSDKPNRPPPARQHRYPRPAAQRTG